MQASRARVLIVGAGIAGLTLGYRLAQYGLFPIVVESGARIANGSTICNEGWLHAGTFHAQSIADSAQAVRVAQRCKYGHDQLRRFCPEAVQDPITPTIALTLDASRVPEILARWDAAQIEFQAVSPSTLRALSPSLRHADVEAAWRVREVSIDTRLLCHKIASAIETLGGAVLCNAAIERLALRSSSLWVDGETIRLSPDFIAVTAGYGVGPLVEAHFGVKLNLRYWKSHLFLSHRVDGPNIYGIDSRGANLAHHRDRTIVGMNDDNLRIETPSIAVDETQVAAMRDALDRLVADVDRDRFSPMACVKIDISDDPRRSRSLDIQTVEIEPNIVCAFPGKMSEAPFLADTLAREIVTKSGHLRSNQRPIDSLIA
ncbi:MAG: NAD(P)/FAD-dependent oxidoreductase [Tagaea sp.]